MLFVVTFVILGMGVLMIHSGIRYSAASMDALWEWHEQAMKKRGLAPQRSEEWEARARNNVLPCFFLGFVCFIFGCFLGYGAIQGNAEMEKYWNGPSGLTINDRALSRREAENCHHDFMECLSKYPPDKR